MAGSILSAAMIAWAQSQIEGVPANHYADVAEGLTWRWRGTALPLQGVQDPGPAGAGFAVTDGQRIYSSTPVLTRFDPAPLLVFHSMLPPQATDLRIVSADPVLGQSIHSSPAMTCVTAQSRIATPQGAVPAGSLAPGDLVLTRDNGPQPVLWINQARLSGARLFATPQLRPIRIRAGMLGAARPDRDLLVGPDQRVLTRAPAARALWGVDEVLIRAADLTDQPGIARDHRSTETTYVAVTLDRHEVIWAEGIEVASFHPGLSDMTHLAATAPPPGYDGPPARRLLTAGEAALVQHRPRNRA